MKYTKLTRSPCGSEYMLRYKTIRECGELKLAVKIGKQEYLITKCVFGYTKPTYQISHKYMDNYKQCNLKEAVYYCCSWFFNTLYIDLYNTNREHILYEENTYFKTGE